MTAIAWSNVVAFAPELASFDAGAQTDLLAFVNVALNVNVWDGEDGPTTKIGRIYLAAHLATMAKLAAAGPLTGERLGDESRNYAAPNAAERSLLAQTSYGRAFLSLIRPIARGPMLV